MICFANNQNAQMLSWFSVEVTQLINAEPKVEHKFS